MNGISNPFYDNLDHEERKRMGQLNRKMSVWVIYVDGERKAKRAPDMTRDLTNDEYFELDRLQTKMWSPQQ